MMPTVLHAVARKAEAATPDAELLDRFIRDRDDPAFAELVRRHGPLVWAVCRQILPCPADAEDAFQAVFLTLVRSAANIRDPRAVPAWLHGVAVRVATRARRGIARRQARERRAAVPAIDRTVSDAAWGTLLAAVHEEVQQLPEAERAAFILCDLQGVAQADAAARLGWALGSVSARLCTARRRLLDRLAARGVAPAALVGIGTIAGAGSAVPAAMIDTVKTFPTAPLAASSGAVVLARGLTEGLTMRVKLAVVATVVVAAFGVSGAVWMARADAQPPAPGGGGSLGPPRSGAPTAPTGGFPQPDGRGSPGLGDSPDAGGPRPGISSGHPTTGGPAWEHKFVDVKNDRKEFERVITQHGNDGWEFCSSERFGSGELVLVFKKRKTDHIGSGGKIGPGMPGMTMPGGPPGFPGGAAPGGRSGGGDTGGVGSADGGPSVTKSFPVKNASAQIAAESLRKAMAGQDVKVGYDVSTNSVIVSSSDPKTLQQLSGVIEKMIADSDRIATGGSAPTGGGPTAGSSPVGSPPTIGGPTVPSTLTVFTLKHAKAADMATVLQQVFDVQRVSVTADTRSNQLVVRSDEDTVPAVKRIIEALDVNVAK